jgi:pimeloyl-ACP methyl ester carboxylesterase
MNIAIEHTDGTVAIRPATRQVELSAATIEYEDTGGEGPPIVLLHGLMMDASLWTDVIAELAVDYRCIVPTLPSVPIATECDSTQISRCEG